MILDEVKNEPLIKMFDSWFGFFVRVNIGFMCVSLSSS